MNSKNKTADKTKKPRAVKAPIKKEKSKVDIDSVLSALGKGGYRVTTGNAPVRKEVISSGSIALDTALGGGFIRGKIVEVYGPESIGKTALIYTIMSQATGLTAYIDCESNYDEKTAQMYGVDTERMILIKPEYIEQGMEATLDLVKQGVEVIAFDSVAGIGTKSEMEGSMEDHNVGKKASRMGQLMRKLHLEADDSGSTVLFINQIRDSMTLYGDPTTTPGGKALKFHSSYRIQFTGKERIPKTEPFLGHYMNGKLVKNKFGKPDIKLQIPLIYGEGISKEWELIDIAEEKGVITRSGSWLSYEDTKLAQGQFNTMLMLQDNPDLFNEIKSKICTIE